MAHLDLDTDTLADAAARLRTAAEAVGAARAGSGTTATTGTAALDTAAQEFWAAWGTTHHALVSEVGALADALARAAAAFEDAERVTATEVANLLGSPA